MKTVFVTWHYPTLGISFLKNVLAYFYTLKNLSQPVDAKNLSQDYYNEIFDNPKSKGFTFDEIYYLTTYQHAFDDLTRGRAKNRKNILEDEIILNQNLKEVFQAILDNQEINHDINKIKDFVKKTYSDKYETFLKLLWRDIHNLSVEQQIQWLLEDSNFTRVYNKDCFKEVKLDVTSLRDEQQIVEKTSEWVKSTFHGKNIQLIINVALCSSETQVVWHTLSETQLLPSNTLLVKTYDERKEGIQKRFKDFSIKNVPLKLISSIIEEFKPYSETHSEKRKLVNKKFKAFLKSGFSILLMGERGTGKSQLVKKAKEKEFLDKPNNIKIIVEANCASFQDDSMAESELFGHVKGSFTGADNDKKGLIEKAKNGILFLDEIHHLSLRVQAKLMKAFQTDQDNIIHIRKLGSNEEIPVEDVRLIFATNKSINELKTILLPDFYDRIAQHVIEIPPLRDTREDIKQDWEDIWKQLKFGNFDHNDIELINWLKTLPLFGNYRDLQKIAMYYHIYQDFDPETKKLISEKTPLEYAKNQFEKYHSPIISQDNKFNFVINKTTTEMIAEYKYELQEWAVKTFGGRKNAIQHFKDLGEEISEKTFNNWKNKKSY